MFGTDCCRVFAQFKTGTGVISSASACAFTTLWRVGGAVTSVLFCVDARACYCRLNKDIVPWYVTALLLCLTSNFPFVFFFFEKAACVSRGRANTGSTLWERSAVTMPWMVSRCGSQFYVLPFSKLSCTIINSSINGCASLDPLCRGHSVHGVCLWVPRTTYRFTFSGAADNKFGFLVNIISTSSCFGSTSILEKRQPIRNLGWHEYVFQAWQEVTAWWWCVV